MKPFSVSFALVSILLLAAALTAARAQDPAAGAPKPLNNPDDTACTAKCYERTSLDYLLLGGIEQSDLSAEDSVTQGFYDLYMEEPLPDSMGSLWFRSRYLGTPSSSDTQNILAAATDPMGTLTAANIAKSITAIDYLIGYQFHRGYSDRVGKLTVNPIVAFGGTSPMSSNTIVSGFKVPDYGTAECNALQSRFTAGYGYNPALPASGKDSAGNMDCVMQPSPSGTGGTQISYLGFSNEDRSSFLLKWAAGLRLTDRWFVKAADPSTYCDANCPRLYADFTVGQDEAFTRGKLRHFVFKADARIPIEDTGLYFFATSANRFERNSTLPPLILSPVTLSTGTVSTTCTASKTTVCFPASNVLILPYKQPDRDYYRIGIAIDAMKVLTKLFNKQSSTANDAPKKQGGGGAGPQQPAPGGAAPAQPPAGGSALLAIPGSAASGR